MSVESHLLRRAAAKARRLADAATPGPWRVDPCRKPGWAQVIWMDPNEGDPEYDGTAVAGGEPDYGPCTSADAEHIASWGPDAARAVADWLDVTARDVGTSSTAFHAALADLGSDA